MDNLLVFFPDTDQAHTADTVGGKGASLIWLCKEGFPVPPGAVLTRAFFDPWFDQLKRTDAWSALIESQPSGWGPSCTALKAACLTLEPDKTQREALKKAVEGLGGLQARFAVRSSSPEEDLSGASFAGGYETALGVRPEGLLDAVRRCFASSLDARVLVYKQQHGFDPLAPSIAVVVQRQLDSAVAGVGFSINPLTNDYDEVVFDASWGQGESVVSGAVTPDHFVVDKRTGSVISLDLGSKQTAIHIDPQGGTTTQAHHASETPSLDDAQITALTALCAKVEARFGHPVDIEWAWADGVLYILQARPITAWVPLPDDMITPPGTRRRLYMDMALSGGLTINAPISPIGQSWMATFSGLLVDTFVGKLPVDFGPEDKLWFLTGGRMYQDLSNVLWLASPKLLAKGQEQGDALMAATLANIDKKQYRAERRPSWVSFKMLLAYPRALWRTRGLLIGAARTLLSPERTRTDYDARSRAFIAKMRAIDPSWTLPEIIERTTERVLKHTLLTTMPPLLTALAASALVGKMIPSKLADLGEDLQRGHEGNVVVEMSKALFRLSRHLSDNDLKDPTALAERIDKGDVSDDFLLGWQTFTKQYGWRGPYEVDLGSPRYADAPVLALTQMCAMGLTAGDFDPEAAHQRTIQARKDAFEALMNELGVTRRWLLKRLYRCMDLFLGTRDNPKHHYLMLFAALRRRALFEGAELAASGRLDEPEHVLDLALEDIEAAKRDPDLDLRARRREHTQFLDQLRRVVKGFPAVIDSRGRILRPAPRPETPGQLTGMPVSPGIAHGPVKVLHTPFEKTVEPGDILVAHTTDPGWTPLFVNAAAVVLEVGGVLQHGAVVAREYGKPCVAGIENLLGRLEDGQYVEVDGTEGVVRQSKPERP